ncbi:hypothetical protein EDB19DRAFT_1951128 [Suillus lakei]|nr:hypothetical protein EDB19DRAFT_1951128 [Suillus lakei]
MLASPPRLSQQTDELDHDSSSTSSFKSAEENTAAPWVTDPDNCIFFYDKHKPFYEFTNFSYHEIEYRGKVYPTSEHLFQSFKACYSFTGPNRHLAERIRLCGDSPSAVFNEAQRLKKYVRADWFNKNVRKMEKAIRYKFEQHDRLKILLLTTGNAHIVEDSPSDYFWGIGATGTGRNELGKALMRLREEFRFENHPKTVHQKSAQVSTNNRAGSESTQLHLLPAANVPQDMCEICKARPKWVDAWGNNSRFCGRTCAFAAQQAQASVDRSQQQQSYEPMDCQWGSVDVGAGSSSMSPTSGHL